ncbi:branched-chain-amino-acid aminotransferase 7 [Pyrus ussuriensis x Pyrus communis]|uniref:Branched-chain-amino-acid aminotransferase 7 n=1 Tax=Pyrus ussuriensis x Pyrus communis TaxID=2448454 RepID=A0A5N5I8I4_9ROSA|nr:branched-chain-amino-acid aminotransferase 7 [Pyrus ussuriensis x Pyrus communis]
MRLCYKLLTQRLLYIRPLLIGSGPVLGLGSATEYTFLIFATPIGSYHKIFRTVQKARAKGFTDVLFLDAATGKNIEEGKETVFCKLREMLTEIQTGLIEDKMGWTLLID